MESFSMSDPSVSWLAGWFTGNLFDEISATAFTHYLGQRSLYGLNRPWFWSFLCFTMVYRWFFPFFREPRRRPSFMDGAASAGWKKVMFNA